MSLVLIGSATLLLAACSKPKTESEVCGTYLADYNVAKEMLTLNPDGTFVQKVTLKATGKVDTTRGPWTYDPKTGYVTFEKNFMSVVDGFHKLNPNYFSSTGNATQPVDSYLWTTYLGADEGVLYKKN